jgi:DinB superfamily
MSTMATTLSSAEIELARTYIEQSRKGIIGATAGLTEAQWSFKPSADCWSIAENMEHIAMVEDRIAGMVAAAEASAAVQENPEALDRMILAMVPNRLSKFKGPEAVMPTGTVAPAESMARFARSSEALGKLLESRHDLRRISLAAPPVKRMSNGAQEMADGYQWILLAAAHTERHTKQILEVIAEPGFPSR